MKNNYIIALLSLIIQNIALGQVASIPVNDNPCGAINIPLNTSPISSSNVNATGTNGVPNPSCGFYSPSDVWFYIDMPEIGFYIQGPKRIRITASSGTITSGGMAIYMANNCSDSFYESSCNVTSGGLPEILYDNYFGGRLYVRVWSSSPHNSGEISIKASFLFDSYNEPCNSIDYNPSEYSYGCKYIRFSFGAPNYYNSFPAPECPDPLGLSYFGMREIWFKSYMIDTAVYIERRRLGPYSANLYSSNCEMAVYTGNDCNNLTQYACATQMPTMKLSNLPLGTNIWIRLWVSGFDFVDDGFSYGICISRPTFPGTCSNRVNPRSTIDSSAVICRMNFCGTTDSTHTRSTWPGLIDAFSECGSYIDNNSFVRFVPRFENFDFKLFITSSRDSLGMQMMVFSCDTPGLGVVKNHGCYNFMKKNDYPYYISATGLTPGKVHYMMFDGFGGDVCRYTVFHSYADLLQNPSLFLFPKDTLTACGSRYRLNAGYGFQTYRWSTGDTTSYIDVLNSGWYKCTTSIGGCSGSDSVYVSLVNADILQRDTSICLGQALVLRVPLTGSNRIIWSTGQTTSQINVAPFQTTKYFCTVSNGISSCTDSVVISVTPYNRNFFPQDTLRACGNSLTLDAGTGNSYSWNTGATTRTINVSNSGRYRCTVTTGNCTALDSVFVSVVRANILNNDTTINAGSSLTLVADSSSFGTPRPALLWSTGSTATRTTVTPQTTTTYSLRVTNGSSSCSDSVRVNIVQPNTLTIRAGGAQLCGPLEINATSTLDVPVSVINFNRIVAFQGTVKWDSTVLRYQSISFTSPTVGFTSGNFSNPAANLLLYTWFDGNAVGQTLPDSGTLFTIRFTSAPGAWNRSTTIQFIGSPNVLEAIQAPTTSMNIVPLSGTVRIGARPVYDTLRLSGCGTVIYNGTTYANSTSVNTILRTASGCDSIYRTAQITVTPLPVVNAPVSNSPVLIGDTLRFTVNGQNLTGGTFSWTGPNGFSSALQNPTLVASAASSGQYRLIYSSTCRRDTQNVSVTVNAGISGRIVSPLNQPVSRVNLLRNNVPALVNGSYSIAASPTTPLVLKAAKNNDVSKVNGVSVLDIVLIQNHILQRTLLNSPYKIIAADVNRSGTLTAFDLLYIKRLILGIDTTFPGNTLWAFADSNYTFPNPANPFPYKDSFSYTSANLQSNRTNQTFIGMKLGDVNYDWNYLQLRPVPAEDVTFYHDDVQPEGNTIRIPVKVKNLKDLLGMQFTLKYNSAVLRFSAIENNRLNLKYGNTRSGEGLLSFIWSDERNLPASLSDYAVLMELVFEKTGEFSSEDIQLVNTIAPIEAWDKNYRKHNIIKGRGSIFNSTKPGTPGWTVSPNPSTGNVVVSLTLQKAQSVELFLSSADGRVLKSWKQSFAAGITAWPLDLKSGGYLPAGMYWLKMPEVDGVVRKIVVE
jgi:hypothetical protein